MSSGGRTSSSDITPPPPPCRRRSLPTRALPRSHRRELACDAPLVDDENAMESERISSSSSETRKIARPASRCSSSRPCTNSIAPTSRPRVGCAAISTFGSPSISRARTTFCWLPPESVGGRRRRRAAAHVEFLQQLARTRGHRAQVQEPALRVRRLSIRVQREVLGQGERQHEAAQMAVLRNVTDAGVERLFRLRVREVMSVDHDPARFHVAQAGDCVDQLALAVRVDACEPEDLACTHVEAHAAHGLSDRDRRSPSGPRPRSSGSPGCPGFFSTRRSTSRPTIIRARLSSVGRRPGSVSTTTPAARW